MIHNMVGGGSGGSGSVLTVVGGTTRPAKATQNMIWANTANEITSYVFSAEEPANPIEGMLWVTLGNSGIVKMCSPVGDEWITVYPISAKQYISGAWVDVSAMSYQNGEWVDWWNGEYFNNGNQFEGVTGGWTADGFTVGDRTMSGETIIGNTIYLKATAAKGAAVAGTVNAVDLKGVSTIYFNVTQVSHSNNCKVGVASTKAIGATAEVEVTNAGIISLDVSALNDKYYIFALSQNSTSATTRTMTIDKVYGE